MLEVANKQDDPRCETLIDFDLTPLIASFPSPGDRNYVSALQFRLQEEKDNQENQLKRVRHTLEKRTKLYAALVKSAQRHARVLADEISQSAVNTTPRDSLARGSTDPVRMTW